LKLELAEFPVKQIRLGRRFAYNAGILEVDEGALIDLVQQDSRIENCSLAVVAPGDRVRIVLQDRATGFAGSLWLPLDTK